MKILFEFEFDEKELGKGWFNIYNLELCLFSKEHTKRELLKVREIIIEPERGEIEKESRKVQNLNI